MPRLRHVLLMLLLLLLLTLLLLSKHGELYALLRTAGEWLPLGWHASPALRRAPLWRSLSRERLPVHRLLRRLKLEELLLLRLLGQDDPASHAAKSDGAATLAGARHSRRRQLARQVS